MCFLDKQVVLSILIIILHLKTFLVKIHPPKTLLLLKTLSSGNSHFSAVPSFTIDNSNKTRVNYLMASKLFVQLYFGL